MRTRSIPVVCLSAIAMAVLSLGASGCCQGVEDDVFESDHDGFIGGEDLQRIRQSEGTSEDRCAAACRFIADASGDFIEDAVECTAYGDVADDAWDPANTEVTVSCTGQVTSPGFCTGRRPQGHREIDPSVASTGRWLAIHAHLERASVRAFLELADWLERRGAPAELQRRCRAAADDEVVHADLMTALASREGAEVPACEADVPTDDLRAVALHNAVEGCVHEAFAAILARQQARTAARAELREVFARIADDELAHGQLAWDLHRWLLGALSAADRREVERAQAAALARLPHVVESNARATPYGLGWPSPAKAAEMAARFAALVDASAAAGVS